MKSVKTRINRAEQSLQERSEQGLSASVLTNEERARRIEALDAETAVIRAMDPARINDWGREVLRRHERLAAIFSLARQRRDAARAAHP